MIGTELFDVYLAMACSVVLLIILIQGINNLNVYFKAKKKLKCVYKYLSRMKLALLIYEWWQADNMTRYKYKTQRSTNQVGLRKNNYCTKIYARTKSPQRHNVRTKAWMQRYVVIQAMCAKENCCQGLSDRPCEFVPGTD
jgi:P2-related tail formation protein